MLDKENQLTSIFFKIGCGSWLLTLFIFVAGLIVLRGIHEPWGAAQLLLMLLAFGGSIGGIAFLLAIVFAVGGYIARQASELEATEPRKSPPPPPSPN